MLRKLLKDNKAGIEELIPAAIVITVLVVLFAIIPVVGYNVDSSWTMPASDAAGGQWNSSANSNIANSSELWETNSPLLSLAVLIGVIFIAIGMLMSRSSIGGGRGGGL